MNFKKERKLKHPYKVKINGITIKEGEEYEGNFARHGRCVMSIIRIKGDFVQYKLRKIDNHGLCDEGLENIDHISRLIYNKSLKPFDKNQKW